MEGAILAERTRQHREMRLKGNAELKERVEELKVRLHTERERMQKDFEGQVGQHATCNRRRSGEQLLFGSFGLVAVQFSAVHAYGLSGLLCDKVEGQAVSQVKSSQVN